MPTVNRSKAGISHKAVVKSATSVWDGPLTRAARHTFRRSVCKTPHENAELELLCGETLIKNPFWGHLHHSEPAFRRTNTHVVRSFAERAGHSFSTGAYLSSRRFTPSLPKSM